jgi:hypothetical protein
MKKWTISLVMVICWFCFGLNTPFPAQHQVKTPSAFTGLSTDAKPTDGIEFGLGISGTTEVVRVSGDHSRVTTLGGLAYVLSKISHKAPTNIILPGNYTYNITNPPTHTSSGTMSFSSTTKTITDANGDFVTKGFAIGMSIEVVNSRSNNFELTIANVTPTTIRVNETLIEEPFGAIATVRFVIPSWINLKPERGAILSIASGKTLYCNAFVDVGPVQWIRGSGHVVFGLSSVQKVFLEWWGGYAGGIIDCTNAFRSAIISFSSKQGIIQLGIGSYLITDEIRVSYHRVGIKGLGPKVSDVLFIPKANGKSVFKFQFVGASQIVQNRIQDFSISSTDTAYQKTGINLVDVSEFRLHNIVINRLLGGSTPSVGLKMAGRDTSIFSDLEIVADVPIQISKNPNNPTSDASGCNFSNLYLIASGANANFLIDDGCNINSISFTGINTFALGGYGIYFNDTTTSIPSYNWKISNILWEQSTNTNGYMIYIVSNGGLYGLTLSNVGCGWDGRTYKGYYFRNILGLGLNSVTYGATSEALNVDYSVETIRFSNCYWKAGSTASTTGLRTAWAEPKTSPTTPLPANGLYTSLKSTNTNQVSNGSFTTDATTWSVDKGSIASIAGGYSGNCLELRGGSTAYQAAYKAVTGLVSGQWYKLEAYVKSGTSGNEGFTIKIWDGSGGEQIDTSVGTYGTSSSTWTKYTHYRKSTATSMYVLLQKNTATEGTMLFDEVNFSVTTPPGIVVSNKDGTVKKTIYLNDAGTGLLFSDE